MLLYLLLPLLSGFKEVVAAIIKFASTTFGAALITGAVVFAYTDLHVHHTVNTQWVLKEKAERLAAEQARVKRDADIKAQLEAQVAQSIEGLQSLNSELEGKVRVYEARIRNTPACTLSADDVSSLRAITGRPPAVRSPSRYPFGLRGTHQ
jgi:sensor domain CHASE-containing protein